MGPAILHAALSTFLGVCFTILGAGFVWRAFFTLWSTVVGAGFLYSTWILPVALSLIGPENEQNEDENMFALAIQEDQLLPEEKHEIESFYLKYEAIKSVLVEYESLKNMEKENDLKKFTKRKKELLKKIWQLNQEHKISLMSKI